MVVTTKLAQYVQSCPNSQSGRTYGSNQITKENTGSIIMVTYTTNAFGGHCWSSPTLGTFSCDLIRVIDYYVWAVGIRSVLKP